jgi:Putative lumazine-binding
MSSSTSQAESRAIADVIQTYFDGLYEGDTESSRARSIRSLASTRWATVRSER